jgi:O-antigen ligase
MKFNIVHFFNFFFIMSALGAYAFMGIPIQWLGIVSSVFVFLIMIINGSVSFSKVHISLFLFIIWALMITLINIPFLVEDVPDLMTTSVEAFISLRVLKILAFVSMLFISIRAFEIMGISKISKYITNIGLVIAIYGLYVYFATLYNFPEIPRGRVGTDGREAITSFTYAFHRATGTFLEPSHFAEWLVVPFFFSFLEKQGRGVYYKKIIIGFLILLTGSLGVILSITLSLIATMLILLIDFQRKLLMLNILSVFFRVILFFIVAVFALDYILSGAFVEQLSERVYQLSDSGLVGSNRGFIYIFLDNQQLPVFGYGLGNSNLFLSDAIDSEAMTSFLSLYLNVLFSAGVLGLLFLIVALLAPIYIILASPVKYNHINLLFIMWPYVTLLILFFVNMEEMTVSFSICYGAMVAFSRIKKA